jgi:hypothetical protein
MFFIIFISDINIGIYKYQLMSNIDNKQIKKTNQSVYNDLLIISCFDYGSHELGLNHLTSLKNQGIENYMSYVADKRTYEIVKKYDFNCILIEDANFSNKQKTFGTKDFVEFSFLRYKSINENLKKYKAVWYLDVDTVVLDNLNNIYKEYIGKNYDIIFQNDVHEIQNCTGCMLYFSNQKTIDITEYIYKALNTEIPDQHFVNFFLFRNPGVFKTSLFDLERFPNGLIYFDDSELIPLSQQFNEFKKLFYSKKDRNKNVAFVHANWMIGIDSKINAIKRKDLWYL